MEKRDFQKATDIVKGLEKYNRYLGAFVYGSVARKETNNSSDLDIKVIVNGYNCENVNSPFMTELRLTSHFLLLPRLRNGLTTWQKKANISRCWLSQLFSLIKQEN